MSTTIDNSRTSLYRLNWNEGRISRSDTDPAASANNNATVTFCGDWGPVGEQETALRNNPKSFYGDVLGCLSDSDLTVVNVEFPIRGNGHSVTKDGPTFCIEPDMLTTLTNLARTVACLANNHMMDFGEQGLVGTLQSLQQLGIKTIGAGMNTAEARQPLVQEVCELKVALVNIAEGEEAKATTSRAGVAPMDIAFVRDQISDLASIMDVVLVVVHAGREFLPVPPPYIQLAYRAIADAGAALIVAHHPHVPQGVEIWNGVPIFYSQGNFVLYDTTHSAGYRRLGYLVQTEINKEGIDSIKIIPYKIGASGLELLTGKARTRFLQDLSHVSSLLDHTTLTTLWNAFADLWFEKRFSGELRQFLQLMSWKDLCGGFSDRLLIQAQQENGIAQLFLKLLGFGFRSLSRRLSGDNELSIKAAAVFRNRFDTMAHGELYKTVMQRIIEGRVGDSADWARELLTAWRVLD